MIADDLIQRSSIGVGHAFPGSLLRRDTRQVAGSSLSMHILSIFVGPVQACDQRDVSSVGSQRLHRLRQLQRIDARNVPEPVVFLDFIRLKSSDESGHLTIFLPRKEAAPDKTVRGIHHHQPPGGLRGLWQRAAEYARQRIQERQRHDGTCGFQKTSSWNGHG